MILPFRQNRLFKVKRWAGDSTGINPEQDSKVEVTSLDAADIVTSEQRMKSFTYANDEDFTLAEGPAHHTVVLDIDVPAQLVQSSTPGKHHLYIDTPMPWETYVKLLDAMEEAGILEPGYVAASKARGFTAVRLPWVSK